MLFGDYYTLLIVIICTALLGILGGMIGSFALLREQSLLGDAIAHACLPGTVLAFLMTGSMQPTILMLGSLGAGICAVGIIHTIRRHTHLKMDAILGGTLSVFFGFGLVCITLAQQHPSQQQAVFTAIIFGSAATLGMYDCWIVAIGACIVLGSLWITWTELTLITFDTTYARACGYHVDRYDALLTGLLIITIALGLPMIGAILMSTLLIAPAAAARLWCTSLVSLVTLAALFGALSSILGTVISAHYLHMPTGPVIAVVAVSWVLISLIIAVCHTKKTCTRNV
jgi:manganese/zinc/iron transport system permease protein